MTTSSTVLSTKPLRVCRICGLKAWTQDDLELFAKDKRLPFGRDNWCKKCSNKKLTKPKPPFLRRCRVCGLEAWNEAELDKFVKDKKAKYGRINVCRDCRNAQYREEGIYHDSASKACKKWYYKNKEKTRGYEKDRASRSIDFLGERITFPFSIRDNVCSDCGKRYPEELKQQTRLHHEKYDAENPLAHTIELCHSCHRKLHASKRKRIKGMFVR